MVLQRLLENQLYVKAEKCEFHTTTTTFLGSIFSHNSIKPDPVKIKAISDWSITSSRKQLPQFLGFTNFYCHFIRNYSSLAHLLTTLTSTKSPFCWTQEANEAFTHLKSHFTEAPHLDPT
ncbi:uncharacterized protein KZ484_003110 [Pholidichthys leucotaenia]